MIDISGSAPSVGVICGVDLVELGRFRSAMDEGGTSFLQRHFTAAELQVCRGSIPRLAARFAAKEAVGKALGVGLPGESSRHIAVTSVPTGAPQVDLTGPMETLADEFGVISWSISLSHTGTMAMAMVVGLLAGARPVDIV